MPSDLAKHLRRSRREVGVTVVDHEVFGGNEDPYELNNVISHIYCLNPEMQLKPRHRR